MTAIERHRQTWQGKSDEWLFERLDNELKQKVGEINRLLAVNEALRKHHVMQSGCPICKSESNWCDDCGNVWRQTVA